MSAYLLPILVGALVLILLIEVVVKSRHLSRLADEISRIKREEENSVEKQKKRDEYMAMLVHELRSPLSVIKGASDLVLKEAEKLTSEQIETLLNQIRQSSDGLLRLVNDFLDVSKMEAGRFDIEKTFGNINSLLKEECDYYSSLTQVKNLRLKTDFDESIVNFNFDTARIKQVMNNLISNAIKYTPSGGEIIVMSKNKRSHTEICVCDDGIGVLPGERDRLFKKFVQTVSHKKSDGESTGLGLVIAKGIVEAHGGEIWFEENKPKGSKFIFTLPVS